MLWIRVSLGLGIRLRMLRFDVEFCLRNCGFFYVSREYNYLGTRT